MKLIDKIVDHYRVVLVLATVLFVWGLFQAPHVRIDNSVDAMLPPHSHVTSMSRIYDREFGKGSGILVAITADDLFTPRFLRELARLTRRLETLDQQILTEFASRRKDQVRRIMGLGGKELDQISDYLGMVRVSDQAQLDACFTNRLEMENMGFDSDFARKVVDRYRALSPVERGRLLSAIAPSFVKEVISLVNADYVVGEGDRFRVGRLLPPGDFSDEAISTLRRRLASWSIYDRFLVGKDLKSTAIMIRLSSLRKEVTEAALVHVQRVLRQSPLSRPPHQVYIAGEPVVTTLIGNNMVRDLAFLFPFVIVVVMLMLLFSFRRVGPMLVPLLAVLCTAVIVVGLMAVAQVPLTVLSVVLPVLLIAVGSAYGIHVVNHYLLTDTPDRKQAVRTALRETFTPVSMAAFTTIGGFAALISSQIIPIRNFGLYTAIGVVLSFLMAVSFVPALLLLFRIRPGYAKSKSNSMDSRILSGLSRFSLKKPKLVIGMALALLVVAVLGATRLAVDTDAVRMFKDDSTIRRADRFLNKYYKGTSTAEVVFTARERNGVLRPDLLRAIDGLDAHLRKNKKLAPHIGGTLSLVDYVKKANQSLHGEDPTRYRIPESRQAILDYMLILKNSTETFCNREGTMQRALIALKTGSTRIARVLRKEVLAWFKANGFEADFNGVVAMYLEVDSLVVLGQVFSILLSLVAVFILNWLVFRSLVEALISLLPLVLAILINFAIMGFAGLLLDVGTSMVASIAIGIGIDYTIHFLNGFRVNTRARGSIDAGLAATGTTTGRAILYNMVAVMFGFAVLPFSSFIPLINFGALIAVTMLTTGLSSLTLVPAVISALRKHHFVQRYTEQNS